MNINIRENGIIKEDNASAINQINLSSSWQSAYVFLCDNTIQNNKLEKIIKKIIIIGDDRFWTTTFNGYRTAV